MHYHSQRDLYEDLDSGRGAERILRNKEVHVSDVKAAAERKTVAEVLRELKEWCGDDYHPMTHDFTEIAETEETAVYAMGFFKMAEQTIPERFDRAIALAESADKESG